MDFQYSPLDLDRPSIRLLRLLAGSEDQPIECQLINAFFDEDFIPDYEAVSYTWGKGEPFGITVDGSAFLVGYNLRLVLRDIRYRNEDRILWVDAICINQGSHGERSHQVRQMDQIYRRAFRVIVWLGPFWYHGTSARNLMLVVADLHEHLSGIGWPSDDDGWPADINQLQGLLFDQQSLRKSFWCILERPWFYRAWIIQEVANARAMLVHCGSNSIPGRIFAKLPLLLQTRLPPHQQAIFDVMPGRSRTNSWWSKQRDLYTVLQKFSLTEATREHDRIYALLGLCDTREKALIPIDYTAPIQDVIRDTLSTICLSGTHIDSSFRLRNLRDLAQLLPFVPFLGFLEWCIQAETKFQTQKRDENPGWDEEQWVQEWRKSFNVRTFKQEVIPNHLVQADLSIDKLQVPEEWIAKRFTVLRITPKSMPCWLLQAAKDRSEPIVRLLLNLGAIVHYADSEGQTALHEASKAGSRAVVETLLARGANPQMKNLSGRTPIDEAEQSGHADIAELLLSSGCDPNGTALLEACAGGHETLVQSLLDTGISTVKTNDRGESPLLLAARKKHIGIVRLLLKKGADPNMADSQGVSQLVEAVTQGWVPVVQLLLGWGANPNETNDRGESALLLAVRAKHGGVVRLLLDKGADPSMAENRGVSPLLEAVKQDSAPMVRLLLAWGASPNETGDSGETPLLLATQERHSHDDIRRLLEGAAALTMADNRGANPSEPDEQVRRRRRHRPEINISKPSILGDGDLRSELRIAGAPLDRVDIEDYIPKPSPGGKARVLKSVDDT